jgi:hypothetical protein
MARLEIQCKAHFTKHCESGLQWKDCINGCTGEAPEMACKVRGFVVKAWGVNSEKEFYHCCNDHDA